MFVQFPLRRCPERQFWVCNTVALFIPLCKFGNAPSATEALAFVYLPIVADAPVHGELPSVHIVILILAPITLP